jgi:DNA polymerase III sliding clamp (beta) subunit (PCNA family)
VAEVAGTPVEADYQAHYLAEALRAIEADDVTLEMRDSLKQGSLRAVGDDDFLYVFMPMRMR